MHVQAYVDSGKCLSYTTAVWIVASRRLDEGWWRVGVYCPRRVYGPETTV